MSTLARIVVLLLVLVTLVIASGLAVVGYAYPALVQPLTLALTGAGVLVALVVGVIAAGRQ
ncbi:hypothetical protein [Streptomyces sp. Tu 3180]|uniref:hypothetical protein n=1 Tax=Streptomyces sp. Tu 3180 TaxID=2682611 RepID=UPI00135C7C64|nr:hypothetical protein [Streptomyces sp. Tu 3180]KAF3469975.1 hypothetical protein GL259_00065 [Streptomyces sp. Tu 3180]